MILGTVWTDEVLIEIQSTKILVYNLERTWRRVLLFYEEHLYANLNTVELQEICQRCIVGITLLLL